jgi:integrase
MQDVEAFLEHLSTRRRSPKTVRLRRSFLVQFLDRGWQPRAASLSELEKLVYRPEWKPETMNAAISSIRGFYRWAVRSELVTRNPAEDLELAHISREVKALADEDAIGAALAVATLPERVMLRLGRECGLRRTEIATLRTTDRVGPWLNVLGKGGRRRRLHMSPALIADLDELEALQGAGFIFPGRWEGHMAPETVYRHIVRLVGSSPHSLRRRAGTTVFRASGNNLRLTQEFLGHSSPTVTAMYVQILDDDLVTAGALAAIDA